ncbi:DUF1831 domain-containing protein [Lactiplantibacillus mudanjiangensis]|uniref:Cysteine desulfurase [Lactobacillus sp.] n=1 Tax=Lactiplantibacillus mudanjiangensis TaxID=1296538 RepID=A0A660EBZ4_9LACO|nr:DUF1831 domain-containing protein [Lactiplantibacillus mudanjiangensis]VDG20757.1 cysteine desulfurase [Lactobacillus sp.] [Lactiplantibacillus mudanjiangensis]VDG24450.1 cysteine desulfurase [Lactobacillus sp.] [Lactiplantibacillus mudanjiangensis]VDG30078.1 cysteine desulfurase [Lactobacillus sp.] [Lactiplantibacillus mudanjiangensis]VDG30565.1 cysteine desulfurase [Lactobacillus sp.] [Lactiplantibacillus mudanjiangensis]
MAYTTTVKLPGDTKTYQLSTGIKKYTLMDLGFTKGKSGAFAYERALDPNSPYNAAFKFKMAVNADLTGFKMSTVTGNGLQHVDIFKNEAHPEAVEQLNYIIKDFLDRDVLIVKA